MEDFLKKHRENARIIHNDTNCSYGEEFEYVYHLDMVVNNVIKYRKVFKNLEDYKMTAIAGFYHDVIEDAQQSFNNVKDVTDIDIARVVLAVTDVNEENRLMRHLMTMGKTVKNYRAIILKMSDILANASYSKKN